MRRQSSSRWWSLGVSLGLAALLAGCSAGGTVSTGGGTPTATSAPGATPTATATLAPGAPTPTPVPAPPHAFAWYQYDSHHIPQIWASVNGGNPHQITHVAPDGAACDDQIAWSPPVFSPDLHHIVASLGSFNCGDGNMQGMVSVIDAATGIVSTLPSGYQVADIGRRTMGWVDNSHIWFVTSDGVFTYHINTPAAPTQLANIPDINDAVLRGSTLYLQVDSTGSPDNWTIELFDITSHMIEGPSIDQGQTGHCQCSPGDAHGPGWDVSPSGAHVVYQKVTPNNSPSGGIASSKIYYASSNGSGATQIAHALIANQTILMQISWDGQWVAFTEATPSPSTLTASVNNPGNNGDPTIHSYHPDSFDYPVWKWDNSQFWAGSVPGDAGYGQGSPALYNYHRGGSSAVGVAHGYNPWYTIGS